MLSSEGGVELSLSSDDLRKHVLKSLKSLEEEKPRESILIIPPDFTRFHSRAGELTCMVYEYFNGKKKRIDIMPALGTHKPMTAEQLDKMFPGIPHEIFRVHDWRNDVVNVGTVPVELVEAASEGKVKEGWPAQLNKMVWEGGHDLVLSIGQVVPHEVLGMANYSKNLFVGVGGSEAIHMSHFIGAVYGIERMLGKMNNPLRKILDYATDQFIKDKLPVVFILTVVGSSDDTGALATRGIYISKERDCFEQAAALSLKVNFSLLQAPLKKVVVYLSPEEFTSTWLGNKSVYRTRMAIATGGDLIVLAPGVDTFGEDEMIDKLIRRFGYRSTDEVLDHLNKSKDLMKNLSAAAHLIHGTSEGRFRITYCPGHLTKEEIESVGYNYGDLKEMMKKYDPKTLKDGFNKLDSGEEIFYVSNPAVGLWAYEGRFETSTNEATSSTSSTSSSSSATTFGASTDKDLPSADVGIGGGVEPDLKKPKKN